jgi:hypothetical protein
MRLLHAQDSTQFRVLSRILINAEPGKGDFKR